MSRAQRVTIQDVAVRAGVSRATVSFVLNQKGGGNYSQSTAEKVWKAVEELGYVPSAAARRLVSGKSQTIGLIASHEGQAPSDPNFLRLYNAVCLASQAQHYRVLLETNADFSQPLVYDSLVRGERVDGLLVYNPRSDDRQLFALIHRGFPLVLLGFRDWPGWEQSAPYVTIDELDSSRRATQHLIQLGHRHIAHLGLAPTVQANTQNQYWGYRLALEAAGLEYRPALACFVGPDPLDAFQITSKLLQHPDPPTALFAGHDVLALAAIAAALERGLRVPQDFAVVGFGDIPMARFFNPPLTTIQVDVESQAHQAVHLLLDCIGDTKPEIHNVCLESSLMVRKSCGL